MPCREVLLAFPHCPNLLLLGAFLKLKLDFIKFRLDLYKFKFNFIKFKLDFIKSKFSFKRDSGKRLLEQRKKAKSPTGRKPKVPQEGRGMPLRKNIKNKTRKDMRKELFIIAMGITAVAHAQSEKTAYDIELNNTEVVGTRAPLPADKAVRLVQVISRKEIEASSANSVNDLLKLAAGVDVRQRGGFGIQTDIGVNGGTEDQLTVLLNGINISNPHTGHLTVDLPVSVDDIERIEIIEGGASRVYGSQAFAGAINIVTRTEQQSNVGAHVQGGSYGTFGANGHVAVKGGGFNNRISGGYSRSDGGTYNDDFNKGNAYWNGKYQSRLFDA